VIASGYSLHLYCDTPGCPNQNCTGSADNPVVPGDFSHEERSVCYKMARKAGWVINMRARTVVCPICSKAGIQPPR
jgi:hypothetical protein